MREYQSKRKSESKGESGSMRESEGERISE